MNIYKTAYIVHGRKSVTLYFKKKEIFIQQPDNSVNAFPNICSQKQNILYFCHTLQ